MSFVWRFAQLLGLLLAALSLFALFRQFLNVGLSVPVRVMMDYYQQFLHVLLGWADEPLNRLIAILRSLIMLPLRLDPNWKHVFVLLWLYFSSDAKTNWQERKGFAIFSVLLGGFIALLTSTIMVDVGTHEVARAAVPMLGVFAWEVVRNIVSSALLISTPAINARGKTRRQLFVQRFVSHTLPILPIAAVVDFGSWFAFQNGWLPFVHDFSTFALTVFVFAMALFWIGRAIALQRFHVSGTAYLGRLMLSALGGAALFLLLNAGLQQLGL